MAGCGGGNEIGGEVDNDLPSALSALQGGNEITPFDSYAIDGLSLYRVALVGVADLSRCNVVGVSTDGEQLISGAALFTRLGDGLTPDEQARRALDILLGKQGGQPLQPDEEMGRQFASEAEWALVRAPAVEAGVLTFFDLRGEMAPSVVRQQVTLATGAVQTTGVGELVREPEPAGVFCEPIAACGCWTGCARFAPQGEQFRAVGGELSGQLFGRTRDCSTLSGGETCRRVCDADGPDATCQDGLSRADEECTEACPPTEAPFHCESSTSGCFRVEHPRRAAR